MSSREGSRNIWAGRWRPAGGLGLAALALLVLAGTARPSWGQADPGAPPQPAVSLPPKDILNPDTAPVRAGGAPRAVVPESDREVRRPAEADGGDGMGRTGGGPVAGGGDERPLTRQEGAKGFWRVGDLLPLTIVLGLVAAAAWIVKRTMPARRLATGSGVLEIVARMPLSSKQSLVLVKMGRQLVLVGVSPDRVNTLCLVDDPDQVAELIGRIASQSPHSATTGFGQSLHQQVEAFHEMDEEAVVHGPGGVRGLLEKVRRLSRNELA